jgi:hypothetical protein
MTNRDAIELSKMVADKDMFPEWRKEITRSLLDYYKAVLHREPKKPIPAVRRMW